MTGCIECGEIVIVSERVEASEYPGGDVLRWAQGPFKIVEPRVSQFVPESDLIIGILPDLISYVLHEFRLHFSYLRYPGISEFGDENYEFITTGIFDVQIICQSVKCNFAQLGYNKKNKHRDNSKPGESRGRKAMDLKSRLMGS